MRANTVNENFAFRQHGTFVRRARLMFGPVLDYVEQGDPRGIPVVLLHGYTDSWRSFEPLLPLLPHRVRAIAISQRGHGDSDRPSAGYRASDLAADLDSLLDAVGIQRAVVVGHSMGSLVALRFALARPDRVLGLVLAGGFATLRGNPIIAALRDAVSSLRDPVDADFARDFQRSTLARPYDEAFLEMVAGESLKVPARIWQEALAAQIEDDVTPELGRIDAPTLVAWGDRDEIATRAMQDTLAASIPGARSVVHRGAGHGLHWDDPHGFATALTAFVDDLAAAR